MEWKKQFRAPNLAVLNRCLLTPAVGFPPQSRPLPPLQSGKVLWEQPVPSVQGFHLSCLSECMISICQRCKYNFFLVVGWKSWKQPEAEKIPRHGWILLFYEAFQQNGKHCPWHSATCVAGDIWLPRGLRVNVSLGLKGHPESVCPDTHADL